MNTIQYSKKKKCKICKKLITNKATRCLSCAKKNKLNPMFGRKCLYMSQMRKNTRGKKSPNYKDGRCLKQYYCIDCKKELSNWKPKRCLSCAIRYIWKDANYKKSVMHPRKNYRGKNSSNYIHGQGNFPYPLEFSKELKLKIRKRDNFECQNCGITEKEHILIVEEILNIHHIDYDKQNCKAGDLITLCRKCNGKANFNIDYWYSYFTYIMEEKYGKI